MKISDKFKILFFIVLILLAVSGCSFFSETDESVDEADGTGRNLRTVKFTPGQTGGIDEEEEQQGESDQTAASETGRARGTAAPAIDNGSGNEDNDDDGGENDGYDFGPSHTFYSTTRPNYNDDYAPNPTEPPVDPGAQGNSPENIAYGGYAAEKDGWIYYKNFSDNGYLYKIRNDGTGKERLTTHTANSINIVGNWIYYLEGTQIGYMYRVRPDGTQRLEVGKYSNKKIYVVGGWVYTQNDFNYIFRFRVTGDGRANLWDHPDTGFYTVKGDHLYLISGFLFYRMDLDGRNNIQLSGEMNGINSYSIIGETVYFTSYARYNKLFRIQTDGTGLEMVIDMPMRNIHAEADRVYFIDEGGSICVINMDGTGLTQLTGAIQVENAYNIAGDWIFYFNSFGNFRRVRTDGSDDQIA